MRNPRAVLVALLSVAAGCRSEPSAPLGPDNATDTDAAQASTGGDDTTSEGGDADVDGSSDTTQGDPPTCNDGRLDGDEQDVDCGGSCPPCPPPEWTCERRLYGDEVCQCGCGALDVDCESDDVSACDDVRCPDGHALDPGQSIVCAEVPDVPPEWSCGAASFGDSACDCGCGIGDFDCPTPDASSCMDVHCPESFALDDEDNALCVPPPADAVDNPSFEVVPDRVGDVPGWTVLQDIGGIASVAVVGAGQTVAPDGSRALRLESTNARVVGARTVRSSAFLPPKGACTVTVAVGDSNEDAEFTDFGQIRVRAPALPAPLDLVAEVDIDNRGQGGVSPPVDGYTDATLEFVADGATLHHVDIRVRASLGTLSYHADDVRIACAGEG